MLWHTHGFKLEEREREKEKQLRYSGFSAVPEYGYVFYYWNGLLPDSGNQPLQLVYYNFIVFSLPRVNLLSYSRCLPELGGIIWNSFRRGPSFVVGNTETIKKIKKSPFFFITENTEGVEKKRNQKKSGLIGCLNDFYSESGWHWLSLIEFATRWAPLGRESEREGKEKKRGAIWLKSHWGSCVRLLHLGPTGVALRLKFSYSSLFFSPFSFDSQSQSPVEVERSALIIGRRSDPRYSSLHFLFNAIFILHGNFCSPNKNGQEEGLIKRGW